MKRVITVLTLAISLAAPAFARKPTITVETDRFTGTTTVVLNPTTTITPRGCRCSIEVSATAAGKNDDASIFVNMTIMAENWMYLNGIDVPVLVDGQPMTLSFRKGATKVGSDAWTYETLLAKVDKATLDHIANSKKFEMELEGMGFSFNAKSIGYFKEFDDAVVKTYPGLVSEAATTTAAVDSRTTFVQQLNDMYSKVTSSTKASGDGNVITIHSDKCSQEKFGELSKQTDLLAAIRKAGFTTVIYTNDKDLKFTYDVTKQ